MKIVWHCSCDQPDYGLRFANENSTLTKRKKRSGSKSRIVKVSGIVEGNLTASLHENSLQSCQVRSKVVTIRERFLETCSTFLITRLATAFPATIPASFARCDPSPNLFRLWSGGWRFSKVLIATFYIETSLWSFILHHHTRLWRTWAGCPDPCSRDRNAPRCPAWWCAPPWNSGTWNRRRASASRTTTCPGTRGGTRTLARSTTPPRPSFRRWRCEWRCASTYGWDAQTSRTCRTAGSRPHGRPPPCRLCGTPFCCASAWDSRSVTMVTGPRLWRETARPGRTCLAALRCPPDRGGLDAIGPGCWMNWRKWVQWSDWDGSLLTRKFADSFRFNISFVLCNFVSVFSRHNHNIPFGTLVNPFTPKFKKYFLPTFLKRMYEWGSEDWLYNHLSSE